MSIKFSKPILDFEDMNGSFFDSKKLPEGWHYRLEREYMGDRSDERIVKTNLEVVEEKFNCKYVAWYRLALVSQFREWSNPSSEQMSEEPLPCAFCGQAPVPCQEYRSDDQYWACGNKACLSYLITQLSDKPYRTLVWNSVQHMIIEQRKKDFEAGWEKFEEAKHYEAPQDPVCYHYFCGYIADAFKDQSK